jgi:hypothetical protein
MTRPWWLEALRKVGRPGTASALCPDSGPLQSCHTPRLPDEVEVDEQVQLLDVLVVARLVRVRSQFLCRIESVSKTRYKVVITCWTRHPHHHSCIKDFTTDCTKGCPWWVCHPRRCCTTPHTESCPLLVCRCRPSCTTTTEATGGTQWG